MNKPCLKFWFLATAIILGSAIFMIKLGAGFDSVGTPLVDTLSVYDWTKGNPSSKVVLIEYSDFQCPACANYTKMIDKILNEFGGHIAFAYRHYPLQTIHKNAMYAAYAVEAAGMQNKFWEMHDTLFTYQKEWVSQVHPEEIFRKFAKGLSLDMEKFNLDYNARAIRKNVDLDIKSGKKNDITYTPTLFLNGKKIKNPKTYDEFRELIRNAIEENS